jgi:hypothetical protein
VSRRLIFLAAILVAGAALLFMPLPAQLQYTLAGRTVENAGHTPLFFVVTLGLLTVLRNDLRLAGRRLYLVGGLVGLAAGFLSEIVQMPLHRDADWFDAFADGVGVVCALAAFALFDRSPGFSRPWRLAAAVLALACVTLWAWPLAKVGYHYAMRNSQFPAIAVFDSTRDLFWITGFGVRRDVVAGALEVEFVDRPFPGVSVKEPYPDWRRYRTLALDVENPEAEPFPLGVRIHDRHHDNSYYDRFNRSFQIAPHERRTLRIAIADIGAAPRGRRIDLGHVADISLFHENQPGAKRLRVYSLRLE